MNRWRKFATALMWASVTGLVSAAPAGKVTMDLPDVIGVTHTGGWYNFTDKDYLTEGADAIAELGVHVIKLWLSDRFEESYKFNMGWPGGIHSMTDLAQTPHFQSVFKRPEFKTIVLEAQWSSTKNFRRGLSAAQVLAVKKECYDLAKHLLTEYRHTGKTFVVQSWEGDNHLAIKDIPDSDRAVAIQGMIDWLNARQDGIELARKEVGMNGVMVVAAAEVNQVPNSYNAPGSARSFDYPLVTDQVLPSTHMDLYSLSAWGPCCMPGLEHTLVEKLNYLASKAPASKIYGRKNIVLGEFGAPENDPVIKNQQVALAVARKQLDFALRWGVRYACYWQIYCNGLREPGNAPQGVAGKYGAAQFRGAWLIHPDGSKTALWKYFKDLCSPGNTSDLRLVWRTKYAQFEAPATNDYSRPQSVVVPAKFKVAEEVTEENDPDAVMVTADSKKVHRTGKWVESGTILFEGKPTLFTRQTGATAKFRLDFRGATQAALSIYKRGDGIRYGDPHMKVTILHNNKTDTLEVDCTHGNTGWLHLGTYDFSGNGNDYVVVTRISPDSENIATRAIAIQYKILPLKAGAK